ISTSTPSTSASSRGSSNLPPWKSSDAIDTSCCPTDQARCPGTPAVNGAPGASQASRSAALGPGRVVPEVTGGSGLGVSGRLAAKSLTQQERCTSDDQRVSHRGQQAAERQQGREGQEAKAHRVEPPPEPLGLHDIPQP